MWVQRRERRLETFIHLKDFFVVFIHFLLILLFISIHYESLLDVGKRAEVYTEAYARAYVKASGSQEVLAMRRQDGARLACKGEIPLLLYEAPTLAY